VTLALGGGAAAAYFLFVKGGDDSSGGGTAVTTAVAGSGDDAPARGSSEQRKEESTGRKQDSSKVPRNSPEGVMSRHWRLIAHGDYQGAFSLFYPSWQQGSGSDFVSEEQTYRPRVNLDTLEIHRRAEPRNGVVTLDVRVVTTDAVGPDRGRCKLWTGWVRTKQYAGEWRYLPGTVNGVTPSFGPADLPSSDSRCPGS
jgi:hypothetical protein